MGSSDQRAQRRRDGDYAYGSNLDFEIFELVAEFLDAVTIPKLALGPIALETRKLALCFQSSSLKMMTCVADAGHRVSVEVLRYSSFRSERHTRSRFFFLCHPEHMKGSCARKRV